MEYTIWYRRHWWWKKVKVSGHRVDKEFDRMDFYFPDETILSLGAWSKYDMKLGLDWVLAMKKQQEKK